MNSPVLKEADYKATTINWLFSKGYLEHDAVLINELPVDNFSRRADLVVANGKLHAFEIKSDADSLTRLEGQIETYITFFDKVTVVCSSKFTSKALSILPSEVEILELSYKNNQKYLKIKRRGKVNKVSDCSYFLSFVDKRSLISFLKSRGLSCTASSRRKDLYKIFNKIPKLHWRGFVLDYLKCKYKNSYSTFLESKDGSVQILDLEKLSPNKARNYLALSSAQHEVSSQKWWGDEYADDELAIDISESMGEFGFVTTSPIKVIPRKSR
ncbi:sce7726 family protein [Shewanella sp. Iso12]|uniref:sce7726 family protein n=1 Tax=Shewanella sp. Iso12 TaxID=1826753 RepID=UPI00142FC3DB|nr:sce7726 family protein [Shewanella sp. Iso12]NJI85520.1 sce7726 family protein [Shewanella sp. Iso12]